METLKKKYGLWTSIAMVVGVVIGSGVFFKADDVLSLTNGNLIIGLVAWVIGAIAMIFGALVFAEFAQRIQKANGVVDYFEVAYGEKFGYLVGWFNGTLYFAPLSAILAWASAMYTLTLFGSSNPDNNIITWILAFIYIILGYCMNYYAPIIAGKFQVTTTVVKLIPLVLIAVVGTIFGLSKGVMIENFIIAGETAGSSISLLPSAVVATAFAFEGWTVAITINNEIKDSKKNLPKALVIGAFVVFIAYIIYFLGINGVLSTSKIIEEGNNSVSIAANALFGNGGSILLTAFIVISCLGTLNGLVISCIRTPYSLAVRNQGPIPKKLAYVNPKTDMPTFSVLYALCISVVYLLIWYGSFNNWFGRFVSIDEIPIVSVYAMYIFLYIWYIRNFKDLNFWKRYGISTLAILGSLVIVYGGIKNPSIGIYLLICIVVLFLGLLFYRKDK